MARSKKLSAIAEKNAKIIYDRLKKSERKNDTDRLFIILYEKYQNGVDYTYKDVDFLKAVIAQDEAERKARNRLADIARDERKAKTREINHKKYKLGGLILGADSTLTNMLGDYSMPFGLVYRVNHEICLYVINWIVSAILNAPNNRTEAVTAIKKLMLIEQIEKDEEYVILTVDLGGERNIDVVITVSREIFWKIDKYEYAECIQIITCLPNDRSPVGLSEFNSVSTNTTKLYEDLYSNGKKEKMREDIKTITEVFDQAKAEMEKTL